MQLLILMFIGNASQQSLKSFITHFPPVQNCEKPNNHSHKLNKKRGFSLFTALSAYIEDLKETNNPNITIIVYFRMENRTACV